MWGVQKYHQANWPSQLMPGNLTRNAKQYHNNNQHIKVTIVVSVKTALFRHSCIEGIFGLPHVSFEHVYPFSRPLSRDALVTCNFGMKPFAFDLNAFERNFMNEMSPPTSVSHFENDSLGSVDSDDDNDDDDNFNDEENCRTT